jgi:cytochrome d ubiquinol oxidase subunit I
VQGLAAVPPGQRPPVNVVRIAFQTMVGIGTLLALLGVLHLVVWIRRRRLPESVWFHRALVAAGPLAVVALIAGWVVTEVGRQP